MPVLTKKPAKKSLAAIIRRAIVLCRMLYTFILYKYVTVINILVGIWGGVEKVYIDQSLNRPPQDARLNLTGVNKMYNTELTTRPGYSMQKDAFAVLWFAYAGDGDRALREIVPVNGMTDRARTMLQRKLELDPYVRQRIAELQGVAAERAIDDAAYLREQLTSLVEDARLDGKYTAAAAALAQFAKMAGLDGVQRVDVTTAGQPVTMTRRIIDPKAPE